MKISIKAKLKKADRQTDIAKFREYHPENHMITR